MKRRLFYLFLISLLGFVSCDPNKNNGNHFDQLPMIQNYADNIIFPAIIDFEDNLIQLGSLSTQFFNNPVYANLILLRTRFMDSWVSWQGVSFLAFGPAEDNYWRENHNTFPADSLRIEESIQSGGIIDHPPFDQMGFPAIEYLLFGLGDDSETLDRYADSDSVGINLRNLLDHKITEMVTQASALKNSWKTDGENFLTTFKSLEGASVGSALGMMVNQINFELELIKNAKLGIPMGKKTMGSTLPDKVESRFSMNSMLLLSQSLEKIHSFYLGDSFLGADGLGLHDNLDSIKAPYGSGFLSTEIENQFALVFSAMENVNGSLVTNIENDMSELEALYSEIQKLIVLTKADLPSVLGVQITYTDNDGD